MSITKQVNDIVNFMKKTVYDSGTNGFSLGMSGGIDSSVCAALAKRAIDELNAVRHMDDPLEIPRPYSLNLIILPMGNHPADAHVAAEVCKELGVEPSTVNLEKSLTEFLNAHELINPDDYSVAKLIGNVKARLRMTAIYFNANKHNTLVIGTDNLSETYTGYFTKHGDGAADVFPLSDFTKREVYELGRFLKLPDAVLTREPSAGLWDGQTDESEMGVPYDFIDNVIEGVRGLNDKTYGHAKSEKFSRVLSRLHSSTEHKRQPPHIFRKDSPTAGEPMILFGT